MSKAQSQTLFVTIIVYFMGFYLTYLLNGYIRKEALGFHLSHEVAIVLSRFSLIGYLVPFAFFHMLRKPEESYFRAGSFTNTIHFPFIWRGVRDPVWRNLLIFVGICLVSSIPAAALHKNDLPALLVLGLAFSVVNSLLEEVLWRGFILSRTAAVFGEKVGLILTSLAFGFYHLNLGFSPWVCLAFSVGGIFMGGMTIRSKGLLPGIVMHFMMNMMFVFYGIIF